MPRSLLSLTFTTSNGIAQIDREITAGSLIFEYAAVTIDTEANAIITEGVIVDFPFFGEGEVNSNVRQGTGNLFIPVTGVQTLFTPKVEIALSKNVKRQFTYKLYDAAGVLITAVVERVTLVFSYES